MFKCLCNVKTESLLKRLNSVGILSVFRLSLTCYIDIVISWCRKKYNSSRIQTSPPNNFSIIKSLFEDVTDVNVKLQIGLLYIYLIFFIWGKTRETQALLIFSSDLINDKATNSMNYWKNVLTCVVKCITNVFVSTNVSIKNVIFKSLL